MKGIDELLFCFCKCGRNIDIGNIGIGKINLRFFLLMGIYLYGILMNYFFGWFGIVENNNLV